MADTAPINLYVNEDDPKEKAFRQWYAPIAAKMHYDPDPYAKEHYYNYRGFYDDMKAGKESNGKPMAPPTEPGGHWVSDYKLPGHPRTFLQDRKGAMFNTYTGNYVGNNAPVSNREMAAAGNAPTLPDMTPEKVQQLKDLAMAMKVAALTK